MKTATSAIGSDPVQAGMTLLELIVVLVIAALMLTLVAPNIARVLPGSELKSLARSSASLLRELRAEAISQSRIVRVQVVVDSRALVSGEQVRLSWPDSVELRLNERTTPAGWQDPFRDTPALEFYPDGSSNGGELALRPAAADAAGGFTVSVEPLTGGVRIHGAG